GKATHTRALTASADVGAEWVVVLEDDALPCPLSRSELADVLQAATQPVVSLYLGTGRWAGTNPRSRAPRVQALVDAAGHSPSRTATALWHAVGYAIRADLLPGLLTHLEASTQPVDQAITRHLGKSARVEYAWPSLVDHADGPTITKHSDGKPR